MNKRPNILTILVDDMGFSDIGCFGGEIDTPNLDRLAANGKRFTQFYNTARCCPARASLLTGLYPHQAGIGGMVYHDFGDGYEGNLNRKCVTFAQLLGDAGYQTMMSGKWHAGHAIDSRPEIRGFQRFTGVYPHIDSYWTVLPGCDIYRDREKLIPASSDPVNPYRPGEEFYSTDFFTDAALDYIDQAQAEAGKPFLLHLCYNAPHFPLEAPDDLIEKYRNRYTDGWDALREKKLRRMREMGIVPPGQTLPEARGFERRRRGDTPVPVAFDTDVLPKWAELSVKDQEEMAFRRAIYAAQIDRLDWNIGRVVERLGKHSILDNTLILFMSDNGCSGERGEFGLNWDKHKIGNYQEWRKRGGWSVSQGQCWASASNTPLRKYKTFVHEGGIASPFIAHWPAGIKDKGSIVNSQVFHFIDILPTLCELAGADYPQEYDGNPITPQQGMNMLPYLIGKPAEHPRGALYWEHEGAAAIREGDWKLVTSDCRNDEVWELYDMSKDRSETADLKSACPDIAADLLRKWQTWARASSVLPYPEGRGAWKATAWPPPEWNQSPVASPPT